jgi:DNA-binding MarR family transcriptional regulator
MLHESIARRLGMTAAEWKCLDLLIRKGPLTAKRLADRSGLTTGAITGIVDRLERAGYVHRENNPGDRRSVIVMPLQRPDLVQKLDPIFLSLEQAMGELFRAYDEKETRAVQDFLIKASEIMRDQTAKVVNEGK